MAWAALILIAVAFGGMALAFGWSERREEKRNLARAEAILARGSITVEVPPGRRELPAPAAAAASPTHREPVAARAARRVRSVA
jgi:hypothetical protein